MLHIESVEQFDELIKNETVLMDFSATWCGPCRMLAPILEEIEEEKSFNGLIRKVDVDDFGEIAARFGIQAVPTLLLFKGGKLVNSAAGYMPKDELLNFLNN